MSKISLQPNASGTGTFTLAAPNSNTNRTLTLPDEAGSVLTDVSDIESQVKTATNATGSAPVYACRAWVNFDGTGTVSIRESGNVSSITDNGTGRYTVNFTTAMQDADYSTVVGGVINTTTPDEEGVAVGLQSNSSFKIFTSNSGTAPKDYELVNTATFR